MAIEEEHSSSLRNTWKSE